MSSSSKRREIDVMKLMMNDYVVEPIEDANNEFHVEFHGPKESLYEGRVWNVYVKLPKTYPYKPPIIRFVDKILHPNIDECGSICLNAINESWSPMFDLMNVFEVFLPQLLLYPNPSHPLNMDAALLLHRDQEQYEQRVKEYCERYAKAEKKTGAQAEEGDDDDSDCQSVPSDVDDDDETNED